MHQLRFPNRPHPFAGRAVEEARYDEVRLLRMARRYRLCRSGHSWAPWFTNAATRKKIMKRRNAA